MKQMRMMTKTARQVDLATSDLLGFSLCAQERYEVGTSAEDRKRRGQFFTPPAVSTFMAGLFSGFPKRLKVLDPGAGIGTLSAAVCERVLRHRLPRHLSLELFETDPSIISLLDDNMKHCRSALERAGHSMSYTIHEADFILSNPEGCGQRTLFDVGTQLDGFDAVIMNPPYFKLARNSQYAQMMDRIVHGQPNIYTLFMALAAEMLRPGDELVTITPRSFCSGLYFRRFRRWFFDRMSLRHIHLFESRTDAFRGANVLQESVITLTQRQTKPPANITISTSFGRDIPRRPLSHEMPMRRVIDKTCGDFVVRIPPTAQDARIMKLVEAWPERFADLGLRVSTGPVVMFRAKEFLLDSVNGKNAAVLLSAHNVRPFETIWPVHSKKKPTELKVCSRSLRLLVPIRNYVLLRRFSAKEERRRLTASCFLRSSETRPYVAFENHLNYVYHAHRELTDNEVYGLAALFNSALLDRYFRIISGNTQVNATELRAMNFPNIRTVARIGERIRNLHTIATDESERIVVDELGINGMLEHDLAEVHDCFSIVELLTYEDLGFCGPGEGKSFLASGASKRDGKVPVNVSGGLLSCGHPVGATGIRMLCEVAEHLRGTAGKRQIPGARIGLTHNIGGPGAVASVMILAKESG